MGRVSVEGAFVTMTGPVKPAAAPWKLLPVWQKTSRYVMGEACVCVGNVNVFHGTAARPVKHVPHVNIAEH